MSIVFLQLARSKIWRIRFSKQRLASLTYISFSTFCISFTIFQREFLFNSHSQYSHFVNIETAKNALKSATGQDSRQQSQFEEGVFATG